MTDPENTPPSPRPESSSATPPPSSEDREAHPTPGPDQPPGETGGTPWSGSPMPGAVPPPPEAAAAHGHAFPPPGGDQPQAGTGWQPVPPPPAPGPWAPGYPAPQPPRPRRTGLLAALVAVPVVVLGIVLTVVLTRGGDEPSGSPAAAGTEVEDGEGVDGAVPVGEAQEPRWHVPVASEDPFAHGLLGSWVTGTTAVRAEAGSVIGYDLASGDVRWELPSSGDERYCGLSAETHENGIVVSHGVGHVCDQLSMVDLDSGETRWQVAPEADEADPGAVLRPVVANGVALTSVVPERLTAHDAGTGEIRWEVELPNPIAADAEARPCRATEAAPAEGFLVVSGHCAPERFAFGEAQRFVARVAPETGAVVWQTVVPGDVIEEGTTGSVRLLSANPPVIGLVVRGEESGPIAVFDPENGTLTHDLVVDGLPIGVDPEPEQGAAPPVPTWSDGSGLVLRSAVGECEETLTRVDLNSGSIAWETDETTCGQLPVAVEGEEPLLVSVGSSNGAPTLATVALADGQVRHLGALGGDPESVWLPLTGRAHRNGDSVVVFPVDSSMTRTAVLAFDAP
ncbi:PQQ-binding-like beta-propeller repeat protein [Actinoalloteichus caeruleus]|uniref:outer membrane protein assembly factor BamB family protein n=1 Tax=Actinoalloteichus cyanogriseus TaxID=2893586 RepID=UPI003BB8509A